MLRRLELCLSWILALKRPSFVEKLTPLRQPGVKRRPRTERQRTSGVLPRATTARTRRRGLPLDAAPMLGYRDHSWSLRLLAARGSCGGAIQWTSSWPLHDR